MVYRFSWLAGIAGIGLALARAERLLRSSVDGVPWEFVLVMAAVLGVTITWAGLAYRLSGRSVAIVNMAAAVVTVIRVAVPSTTWFIFPTAASFSALADELAFARDVISSGIAPVIPLSGVIAILALVFWALGALLSWGLSRGRPYIAVLAPLIVYLEFAVMDRRPSGAWTTAFMLFIGAALLAVSFDRRREGTGLLTSGVTRLALVRSLPSIAVVTLALSLLVAVIAANLMSGLVPYSGFLDWRANTGLSGEYYGSVAYNPFVGIRQNLISQTNVPVFVAAVEGDVAAADLYWRMVTLDSFDGVQWHVGGESEIARPEELVAFETSGDFFGPTDSVTQEVTVLALQMDWLPAAYAPIGLTAPNRAVDRGFRVKADDASLRFDALTYRGMVYTVESEVPRPDLDVLSRTDDGAVSVVFAGAIEAEEYEPGPGTPTIEVVELEGADRFLALPETIEGRIRLLAIETTRGLQTDFEKAIALETFFRTPGNFAYSTSIVPGHGATSLADWLLDPASDNYRTGYCEQFATSMAVMARMLGIPSRVVLGFTPGTLLEDGRVVVRDRNAHAWVEMWMPTQGWVRFDPTPRGDGINPTTVGELPFDAATYLDVPVPDVIVNADSSQGGVLVRDEDPIDVPDRVTATGGGDDASNGPLLPAWFLPIGVGAFIMFGLVPVVKWARRRRRLRLLDNGDISAAWREIVDRLTDLGDGPRFDATPMETAERTDPVMRPLADAYGAQIYGTGAGDRIATATRSLEDTEDRLLSRYSLGRRVIAWYRVETLIPTWLKRRRKSRD
jgi:transglutaminase-like putative cysteine protease